MYTHFGPLTLRVFKHSLTVNILNNLSPSLYVEIKFKLKSLDTIIISNILYKKSDIVQQLDTNILRFFYGQAKNSNNFFKKNWVGFPNALVKFWLRRGWWNRTFPVMNRHRNFKATMQINAVSHKNQKLMSFNAMSSVKMDTLTLYFWGHPFPRKILSGVSQICIHMSDFISIIYWK